MSFIYFAAHAGRIKIGFTRRDAAQRVSEIAAHHTEPVMLLGHIEGSLAFEQAIHRHLSGHNIKGEWFRDNQETRRAVDDLIARGPAAISFEEPPRTLSVRSVPIQPPDPKLFGTLVRLVWPNDAQRQLAAFSETSESICAAWLEGTIKPPRLVRAAFGALLFCWMADQDISPFMPKVDDSAA